MGLLTAPRSIILDTCALVWWHMGMPQLSAGAKQAIADPATVKFVSAASAWEIITKWRSGKEPGFAGIAADVTAIVRFHGFRELALSMAHACQAANLPLRHRDPFDRMIIAQALLEGMAVVSSDTNFPGYGVRMVW